MSNSRGTGVLGVSVKPFSTRLFIAPSLLPRSMLICCLVSIFFTIKYSYTSSCAFGKDVAVLHSKMSEGERFDSWRELLEGKKKVAIGPRSAVFAPVQNLGLIIVDEEHDQSYKQHESPPYYSARDVAVYRAHVTGSKIVMGSATPSLETYYNAIEGKYKLHEMPNRIENTELPEIILLDRKEVGKRYSGKPPIFSDEILRETEKRLKNNEQIMILLNRRGYSTFIQCSDCGNVESCENCKITLTFHKGINNAICHMCGFIRQGVSFCVECSGANMRYSGIGTEQIEEILKERFPEYGTLRMDQDTTRNKTAQRKITEAFEKGEADILVGTQMIAKGFDFGNVNFVGVLSADTGLHLPEFRAAERTFQLMTQAAGRAGRRKQRGLVMIQTTSPNHYSLKSAVNHDYKEFYKEECEIRKELNYPPYGRIILLRFFGNDAAHVENLSAKVGSALRAQDYAPHFLGPAPAPIEKIKNMYRWQIFLKSSKEEDPNGNIIRSAAHYAREVFKDIKKSYEVNMTIDVDPLNLL